MLRSVSILRAIALAGTVLTVSGTSPVIAQSDEPYFVCWSNFYRAQPFVSENFVLRYLADGRSRATEKELEAELEEYVLAQEPSLVHGSTNCNTYPTAENAQIWLGKLRADPPQIKIADIVLGKVTKKDPAKEAAETKTTEQSPKYEPTKSKAQVGAEEAAARRAKYEAEFQAKQAEYERKLAEQQKQVEDFKRAQEEVERTKAENQVKADAAAAKFKAEQDAYAETVRHNEAQQEAAKKLMADWDARHGLKAKASTDTDANQCVTTAETQLNATFKGNTAASILNGCGQPVDVRICLMTSTKGWNCGVGYGVGSQEKWSWSSFDATGPVFVDARISGSSKSLAHPQ